MRLRRRLRSPLAAALAGALAGCTVGPHFKKPEAPATPRYTTTPLPAETASADGTGGQPQRFSDERDVPAEWWTVFESEALDALVRRALTDSPKLSGAQAKLRRAREDLEARRGATQLPKVDARVSANRIDVNPESLGVPQLPVDTPLTLYDASVRVSYTLDLFGHTRRELEALQAEVDYQRFELEGARLILAGNVVTAAIRAASLGQQIDETEQAIALQEKALGITERLERLGGVSRLDVTTQRAELAERRASLPDLRKRLEQTRHRLAVYLGQPPGSAELPEMRLADLTLPSELPLSLPSELVRQRPDIQAAEALLHQASARVGVATADFYPRITLSATAGSLSTALGDLFASGTGFYFLGASLLQPIFRGGELKAKKRAAVAAFDQAGAAYREAVLAGFQNVADILAALDTDAAALRARAEAARLAGEAFEIMSKRYEAGGVSQLDLIDAERRHHVAIVERTQAIADRYADTAALFQALGGGWWDAADRALTPANRGAR